MNEIESLIKKANDFPDERNWRQYRTAKDLTISLSIEASKLLQAFQWKTSEEPWEEKKENIKEEIADVLIYAMNLCRELNINVKGVLVDKKQKNKETNKLYYKKIKSLICIKNLE